MWRFLEDFGDPPLGAGFVGEDGDRGSVFVKEVDVADEVQQCLSFQCLALDVYVLLPLLLVESVNVPQVDPFSAFLVTQLTGRTSCLFITHQGVLHLHTVLESVAFDAGMQVAGSDELWHVGKGNRAHSHLMKEFDAILSAFREDTGLFPNEGVFAVPPFGQKLEGRAHPSSSIELLSCQHFLAFFNGQSSEGRRHMH